MKSLKKQKCTKSDESSSRKKVATNKITLTKSKLKNKVVAVNQTENKNVKEKVKRKGYTLAAVHEAIKAVREGVSFRKAGRTFGVPSATLCRMLKDPEGIGKKNGPPAVLNVQEEEEIVKWIIYRGETGSPVTKVELFDYIKSFLSKENKHTIFKNNCPGKKWYHNFRKRHPDLILRTPQNLPLAKAMITEESLRKWFFEVEKYLKKRDLKNADACRVFNCGETNVQLHPEHDTPETENVTVLFMYNAEGTRAPPMILYNYKEMPDKVLEKCPQDWAVGLSDSGWINAETFYQYITTVFYPWLVKSNIEFPVLLYIDGHASHVSLPLVIFCKEKKIELIILLAHSKHIIQPLAIAFFHLMKDVYNKTAVAKWKSENNHSCMRKEDFPGALKITLDLFFEEKKVLVNGFKAAGLYPFDPEVIDYNVLKKIKNKRPNSMECQTTKGKETPINICEDTEQHLKTFMQNLPESVLDIFNRCKETEELIGGLEN